MNDDELKVQVYKISELNSALRGVIQEKFGSVWVEGEVSNLNVPNSGHTYFSLKDESSQIKCALFKHSRSKLKYVPENGDQVLLSGKISIYEPRGEYQITVSDIEPRGRGVLQKAFEELKKKLSEEGLFDDDRKKPIPDFPWRVGIITSETGAALRDMLKVIKRRNSKLSVLVHPVAVQGEGAGEEIADAIHNVNQCANVDVLIVGRGGGSIEDLWAFNEEIVARAIAASSIPIVSAVGHETDYTVSDFVSDKRASTPSAAAELVVPILEDSLKVIRDSSSQLVTIMKSKIKAHRDVLRRMMERKFFRRPERIWEPGAQKLDDLNNRLDHIILRCLSDQERKIANLDDRLERGYINRKLLIEQKRQKVIAVVLGLIVTLGFIVWILMK